MEDDETSPHKYMQTYRLFKLYLRQFYTPTGNAKPAPGHAAHPCLYIAKDSRMAGITTRGKDTSPQFIPARFLYPRGEPTDDPEVTPILGAWLSEGVEVDIPLMGLGKNGEAEPVKYLLTRFLLLLHQGPAPRDMTKPTASHLCHNTACCNIQHLVLEAQEVNKSRNYCPYLPNATCINLGAHYPPCLVPGNQYQVLLDATKARGATIPSTQSAKPQLATAGPQQSQSQPLVRVPSSVTGVDSESEDEESS